MNSVKPSLCNCKQLPSLKEKKLRDMLSQSLFLLLKIHGQSLHMSQVSHQARAHLNVCSMKQLRAKLDASGLQGYLPLSIKYVSTHLFT